MRFLEGLESRNPQSICNQLEAAGMDKKARYLLAAIRIGLGWIFLLFFIDYFFDFGQGTPFGSFKRYIYSIFKNISNDLF